MPIFQDPDRRLETPALPRPATYPPPATVVPRTSEESIRTEFCEGPVPDDPPSSASAAMTLPEPSEGAEPGREAYQRLPAWDRAELIERIKRSHPAAWRGPSPTRELSSEENDDARNSTSPRNAGPQAALLPAIQLKGPISPEQAARNEDAQASNLSSGREIPRPPSALHAGDFTPTQGPAVRGDAMQTQFPAWPLAEASPSSPSIDISPLRHTSLLSPPPIQASASFEYPLSPPRKRAPSYQSYSSIFVPKPPTSPLVQQENNEDLSFGFPGTQHPTKGNRRRTLPADGLQNLRSLPSSLAQAARQPAAFQTDLSFLTQSREARRSAVFNNNTLGSVSPPTPGFLRSRRTSFSSGGSPLQPSSMVGSYEESILRGRMSTTPSKPMDFTAQIGALGKGDCKPKFPDHVTLSFPAVFYNWNTFEPTMSTEPSPYVGQIDLQHDLPPPKRKEKKPKTGDDTELHEGQIDGSQPLDAPPERSRRRKRSISPSKRPVGGSYRIPRHGQLQILIKNPNKTAVKLFLIPYDLEGMEPGTKTFIRQNSYSAGPIIEAPILTRTRSESSSDGKQASRNERPTLRYSIHLHICCPSKGRYYLYKSIKVVFANRVPDNTERLRNEIRLPEPRFSPYRPSSEVISSSSLASLRQGLDRENRQRPSHQIADSFDGMTHVSHRRVPSLGPYYTSPPRPTPIVRNFSRPTQIAVPATPLTTDSKAPAVASPQHGPEMGTLSHQLRRVLPDRSDSLQSNSSSASTDSAYNKLNKGDVGYGGLFVRPWTPECSEGLLSRRLRTIDPRGSLPSSRHNESS